MTELLNAYLGKWPRLIVVGERVTPEQAMEILIRTDHLNFSSNDAHFSSQCAAYLYGLQNLGNRSRGHWSLSDTFEGDDRWEKCGELTDRIKNDLRILDLNYLTNEQVVSCWVGGPHGWCDWDGVIGCSNHNIGKWPVVEEVFKEWQAIALAFPFLNLKSQLITEEGEGDIAVEYHINGGIVTLHSPGELLQPVREPNMGGLIARLNGAKGERGCTFEQFKQAVDYTRKQVGAIM